MSIYRRFLILCLILGGVVLLGVPSKSQVVGKNVNMVSGTKLPGGDPFLQRQNEPSLAVSTRNPMHLLAGANDYRTVDMPYLSDYIPNYEPNYNQAPQDTRDAWLGVFKSIDGGESWFSTLLPGFPQDFSLEGNISPIKGYTTAADPVVRAGTNGMFYYSGIAFNRVGTDPSSQNGAVFIARFIDNNDQEAGDPIQYIDTKIIHAEPSGRFIDKPWIAVDLPREGQGTLSLVARDVPAQQIARHTVYMAYTLFEGEGVSMHSTIYVVHSEDCGATWSEPFPISGANTINQGAVLDINPENGKLYIAWRRFATIDGQTDAILMACFGPQGQYYEPPVVIAELLPFDQPTQTTQTMQTTGEIPFSFRTNSYPTLAVDNLHNIHVAWSQRTIIAENQPSRIMISHSTNGKDWTVPQAVDHCGSYSHQFMPSLNYGGGRLALVWYDQRDDLNQNFNEFIRDFFNSSTQTGLITHTLDLRVAVAESGAHPLFGASQRLTKFLHVLEPEPTNGPASKQAEYHYPTMPLFMQGSAPFLGDYIDLAFQKFILKNDKQWTYNDDVDLALFHAAWADNRDVVPPLDGDWVNYTPPTSEQDWDFQSGVDCIPDKTGMRNQNIYTASISGGLVVGAPGNAKPLNIQRAFVVFVKNETDSLKTYRLTIESSGPEASFLQFESLDSLEVEVASYSSVARTVYVSPSSSKNTVRVNVTEVGGTLSSYVDLNADPTNPNVRNPNVRNPNVRNPNVRNYEVYNPNVRNPNVRNEGVDNPNVRNELLTDVNVLNPNVRNTELQNNSIVNPNVRNDDLLNPNVRNADLTNPNVRNDNLLNPNVRNEAIGDPSGDPDPFIDDYTWVVRNDGNTTAAYMYSAVTNETVPDGIHLQLLIYKVHTAPVAKACELKEEHHDELLVNISDPTLYGSFADVENPNVRNDALLNPNVRNASFYLGPGEEAWITLRVYDPDKNDTVSFDPAVVEMAATSLAVNTEDAENGVTDPFIAKSVLMVHPLNLPAAYIDQDYNASLAASGGELPYTWTENGSVLDSAGLHLNADGTITGVPHTLGTFTFEAVVTDSSPAPVPPDPPTNTASATLTIRIIDPLIVMTDILPEGFKGGNYSAALAAIGGSGTITWTLAGGSLPNGLSLSPDGTIAGKPSSIGVYNFIVQAVDSSSPTQNAVKNLQISIAEIIEDWVAFYDGGFPQSTIKKNVNAAVLDSSGNLYITGKDMHTYRGDTDIFIMKYDSNGNRAWDEPYRFDGNGFDDEAVAITLDSSQNFVYVAGYTGTSSGKKDFITIKIDASGENPVYEWSSAYNGPGNDDDWAVDIATDASNKVFITGTSTGGTGNQMDICTICYDPLDGTALWTKPKNLIGDQFARAIILNGAELFVGGTTDQPGSPEYYILKYVSVSGNEIIAGWPVVYGGSGTDDLVDMVLDGSGNPIVTGKSNSFGGGDYDYVTMKFDGSSGAVMWMTNPEPPELPEPKPHVFDGSGRHDEPFAMTIDSAGNVYVTGRSDTTDEPDPLSDYGTVKIDGTTGDSLWPVFAFYDGPTAEQDVATAIAVDETPSTGGVYVAGYSDGYQTAYDYALVKYDLSSGDEQWNMRYDYFTHFNDEARILVLDASGNPIVSGHIINQGDDEIHTIKCDTDGGLLWEQTILGLEDVWGDPSRGLSVDASGNIYASGPSYQDGNSYDFALTKFGPDGSELWSIDPVDFSGNGRDWVVGNELDGQGFIYVAGTVIGDHGTTPSLDPADLNTDWGVVKYNASSGGKPTPVPGWPIEYNGPGGMFDWLADFHVDDSGNVYMTGDTDVPTYFGYGKMAVVKYDTSGSWSWEWQGPQNSYAHAVTSDSDGYVYATGTAETSPGNWDIIVVKLDPSGGLVWGDPVFYDGTGGNDRGHGIAVDEEGNIHVTGFSASNTGQDYITLKFDSGGNLLWAARYDGTNHTHDQAYEIKLDDAGNVYVTGLSAGFETGYDVATIKYDSDGNELWVARYDSPFHQAENISYQDYPLYIDHQGNVYVSFISRMGDERQNDAAVVMYDKNGSLVWSKVFNSTYSNIDNAHAIKMDPDGNIIISVSCYTYETRGDRCVVKYTKKK